MERASQQKSVASRLYRERPRGWSHSGFKSEARLLPKRPPKTALSGGLLFSCVRERGTDSLEGN